MQNKIRKNLGELSKVFDELWKPLTDNEKTLIDESAIFQTYEKGHHIYEIGRIPMYIFYIIHGKVKIQKDSDDGTPKIIRIFTEGQFFGYRAFFASDLYTSESVTVEPTRVILFPTKVISKLADENRSVNHFFIRELAHGLGLSDDRVVSLAQKHLRGRLAETLLFLSRSFGTDENGWIKGKISRGDIANLANMSTSNAIRTLAQFRKESIIDTDGKLIRISRPEKMLYISNKE